LAGGVDAVRDRQQRIAEGLRATETGAPQTRVSSRAAEPSAEREPPPVKPTDLIDSKVEAAPVVKSPTTGTASNRRGILGGVGVFVVVAAVTLLALGRWPGPKRTPLVLDQSEWHTRNAEMQPVAPPPSGARVPTERGEAVPPTEPTLGESVLLRVAGHLIAETVPPGAMVWVDGVLKGKTFADIVVGEGGHRIVLVAAGHRMFRDVVDTSRGAIVRRTLAPIDPPIHGNGFIDVECQTHGKFPVLLDEEETGLLCPAKMLPTATGKHLVGIFVPQERRTVSVETTVEIGSRAAVVTFSE
jgi:hypothetical protein